jgi:DNA-binding NarL/FixJ family response regulator
MTHGEIRVLVVDDHAVVREGLKRILSAAPRMRVAGEAGSAREALEMMRSQEWDVVLLDIALPDRSGFEVLQEIKREKPALCVLVLSIYPPDQFAVRVMGRGPQGTSPRKAHLAEHT